MKTMTNIRKVMLIAMLALFATTSFARHRHCGSAHHHSNHRPAVVVVVSRPSVTARTINRTNKKDRLEMALAYLKSHKSLSVSAYRKMTGLTNAMAEAELDAFAFSRSNPIKLVMDGKKKLYVA